MRFITAKRDEGKKMFKQWTFYGDIRISIGRKTKQKKKRKKITYEYKRFQVRIEVYMYNCGHGGKGRSKTMANRPEQITQD